MKMQQPDPQYSYPMNQTKKIMANQLNSRPAKCIGNNDAYLFCFNENCKQKNPFTCIQKICNQKCNNQHKKCSQKPIESVLQLIRQKKNDSLKITQIIQQVIQKNTKLLDELKNNYKNLPHEKGEFIGLSQIEIKFYKLFINEQNAQTFNSRNLSSLWQIINKQKSQNKDLIDQIKVKLQIFQKSIINSVNILAGQINQIVQRKITYQKQESISQTLLKQSSIINSAQKYLTLTNFFPRKIKELKLLFKASENKFRLKKYYQNFESQTNTIIICQTNKNRILGGYTPLNFNNKPQIGNCSVQDFSLSSFVFSLTTNQKFVYKKGRHAITRMHNQSYIVFGNQYFWIADKGNLKKFSGINLGCADYDSLQYKNQPQSYKLILDQQQEEFTLKQWEVLKVTF